ncbi:MAG: hypothetical protein PF541_07490 [Prolixibacteraceae bacterium]|nr:hypothetical protein [Prolixibacteraceae bacterium]
MKQPEIIREGNKLITYLDFSNLRKKEEVIEQIRIYGKYIKGQPLNSVITLTNLEGMYFNTDIYNKFTTYVKENNYYVKESAVIGLKGMMQIFYKSFIKLTGRNVKVCSTKSEALYELTNEVAEAI